METFFTQNASDSCISVKTILKNSLIHDTDV